MVEGHDVTNVDMVQGQMATDDTGTDEDPAGGGRVLHARLDQPELADEAEERRDPGEVHGRDEEQDRDQRGELGQSPQADQRSEERRVGKERRARRWQWPKNKKDKKDSKKR